MKRFDVYVHDKFICSLLAKNILQALKKAEEHGWIYNQIINRLQPGTSIELILVDQSVPGHCMTFIYEYDPLAKKSCNLYTNSMLPGFVYLRVRHDLYRKCLALKMKDKVAFFNGIDFVCIRKLGLDFAFDDIGLKTFAADFPHHFDSQYFDTIFEILKETVSETQSIYM